MKKCLFTVALLSLMSVNGYGWGQKGHDTTCAIAQNHLSKKARKAITKLLDGKSIVYWSNWLDNASNSPEYAYSKTWHYKNVDADQTWDNAPVNSTGDVVTALHQQIDILKSATTSRAEKQLALKMVVHLVGDLHQPMHMGHKSDLGGNKWTVTYFKSSTNLHSVWDSQLVESAHKWSHNEWVEEIDRVSRYEAKSIAQGTIEDWGRETLALATQVYEATPMNASLSYDYVATWTPVVEQQFLKGGIRLAKVLNEIF